MPERKLNGASTPPPVRCFVGALVDAASARRLQRAFLKQYPRFAADRSSGAGGARLVPLANLHVTIRFLGPVPEPELAGLVDLVTALGGRPVTAEVVGYAGLPRSQWAHSAVAELAPHPELEDWKRRLEQSVGAEERPFRPHVTLARFRTRGVFAAAALEPPQLLELHAPRLFRSDQVRGGVRYTPVSRGPEP